MNPEPTGRRGTAWAVLALGVAVVSSASILIRYAQEAGVSSLVIAAGRLAIASLVLTPFAWRALREELPRLAARDLAVAIAAGCALALHFASWISSLEYTSVASSTVLVTTNPVWVGLASVMLLGERVRWATWLGIGLTVLGTVIILIADSALAPARREGSALLGNGLALVGALTASAYLLIGRALRGRLSLAAYVWLVYSVAALVLGAMAGAGGAQVTGFPLVAYLCVVALALGPQLIGHTAINYTLRRVSATATAVAILGEPVGSALLAWALLAEPIGAAQMLGFAAIAIGIVVAARAESR